MITNIQIYSLKILILIVLVKQSCSNTINSCFQNNTCASASCSVNNLYGWDSFKFGDVTRTVGQNVDIFHSRQIVGYNLKQWWVKPSYNKCITQLIKNVTYDIEPYYGMGISTFSFTATVVSGSPTSKSSFYLKIQSFDIFSDTFQTTYGLNNNFYQYDMQYVFSGSIFYDIQSTNKTLRITICNTSPDQVLLAFSSIYIGNELDHIKYQDSCSTNQQRLQIAGNYGCLPNIAKTQSINCDRFGWFSSSGLDIVCSSCANITKYLVYLETGYRGCSHNNISNVKSYKKTDIKDSNGLIYLTSVNCNNKTSILYSLTAKIAVPYLNAPVVDITGPACIADYANILIYQVNNSVYVPVGCPTNYILVNLIQSTGMKGCISLDNINHDVNCLSYKYTTEFMCRKCLPTASPLTSLPVRINNIIIYECPKNSSQIQSLCTEYIDTIDGSKSCNVCPSPNFMLPGINSIQVCVKTKVVLCNIYKTDGTCAQCSSGVAYDTINKVCPCKSDQTKLTLLDNSVDCLKKAFITSNVNCYKFKYSQNAVNSFQCGSCDISSTSTTKILVNLSNSNKGCIQYLIPNTQTYETTSIKDLKGKFYLKPLTCSSSLNIAYSSFAKVAIPSFSASVKDINGLACIGDYANIGIWEVISGQFSPAGCLTGNFVDLIESTYLKGCILTENQNYDSNCIQYKYLTDFACKKCAPYSSPLNSLPVVINDKTIWRCPQNSTQVQQLCTNYVEMPSGQKSCNVCPSPYKSLPGKTGINICLSSSIYICKYYKTDGTCEQCYSGMPFDLVNHICPCNANTHTRLTLKNAQQDCVFTTTYQGSVNCKYFSLKSQSLTEHECVECDTNMVIVNMVGGYKGCSHFIIPNAATYVKTQIKDKLNYFYLKPATCNTSLSIIYSSNAKIAIPNYKALIKDTTGPACLAHIANITIWEVRIGSYYPVSCFDGNFVNLTQFSIQYGCIQTSNPNYDSNCILYKYTNDYTCKKCSPSTNPLNSIPVNINGNVIWKCPKNSSQIQLLCSQYINLPDGSKSCKQCNAPNILVFGLNQIKICIQKIIQNCNLYTTDGKCQQCQSGVLFNDTTKLCPIAASVLPSCQTVRLVNFTYICITCISHYTFEGQNCVKQVFYCAIYLGGQCKQCTRGYFLVSGICIKQSQQCLKTDKNGKCTSCKPKFIVDNGLCLKQVEIIACDSNQYKNRQGFCTNGNIQNCQNYQSPSGKCINCLPGYKNNGSKCVITCPNPSYSQKYILKNGICIKTDNECVDANDDGTCQICNSGYYSFEGNCKKIQDQHKSNEQIDTILADESNNWYLLMPDGSRLYITGPWNKKQVWSDQRGRLYENIKNGGRLYLTGFLSGYNSYPLQNGNWFYINSKGQRIQYSMQISREKYIVGENLSNLRR